jgi:hypothetical protein
MRSRDGDHTFTRSVLLLALFSSLALNASEFLISYRYVIKDAILYNETLDVAKAMKKCSGTAQKLLSLEHHNRKDIRDILSINSTEFIEFIHKLGLDVSHRGETINMQNSSTTILTLKTTCFKVDINENFAIIAPLK